MDLRPAGWIVDLNEFIKGSAKTNPNYNWDDGAGLRASSLNGAGSNRPRLWCNL
jgi:hypothetical protein